MKSLPAFGLLLAGAALLVPAELPRKSPELAIGMPDGGQISLSQYRGKVVLVEFLVTTCPHCQHAAQVMNRLQAEYGPKGFQAIGVAFNEQDKGQITNFVRAFGVKYPIGFAPRETAYKYLQADINTGFHVPQLVFIDRSGVIRLQSLPREDHVTAREDNIRNWLDKLLKEPAAARRSTSRKPA
jgi:peroxiredoxin